MHPWIKREVEKESESLVIDSCVFEGLTRIID